MHNGTGIRATMQPLAFFALVFAMSWPFWIVAILFKINMESPLGIVLGLLGLLGQKVAGIVAMRYTYGEARRRDYWRRITDTKRISPKLYSFIFLSVPVTIGLAALLDVLTGGGGFEWGQPALDFVARPWTIIPFSLLIFFVGPMEEFSWRGYVLDPLQERWSALTSSLILGVVWSLWHLPLFFFPGSYQHGLGAGSAQFWQFMIGIVPLTVVFTWLFNNTNRSTLGAMLFHFMINFSAEMADLTQRADLYWIVLWTVLAVGLTFVYGPKTLAGSVAKGGGRGATDYSGKRFTQEF